MKLAKVSEAHPHLGLDSYLGLGTTLLLLKHVLFHYYITGYVASLLSITLMVCSFLSGLNPHS